MAIVESNSVDLATWKNFIWSNFRIDIKNISNFSEPQSDCFYLQVCIPSRYDLGGSPGVDENDYVFNMTHKASGSIYMLASRSNSMFQHVDVTLQFLQRLFSGKSNIINEVSIINWLYNYNILERSWMDQAFRNYSL
jgi:hypothetical protein